MDWTYGKGRTRLIKLEQPRIDVPRWNQRSGITVELGSAEGLCVPIYHFHIDDGESVPDLVGTELDGIEAAKIQAVQAAGEMLNDLDGEFWKTGSPWAMHVTDEVGILQFSLSFTAFQPSGEVIYIPKEDE